MSAARRLPKNAAPAADSCQLIADSYPQGLTEAAMMRTVALHLAPYDADTIAANVGATPRAAENWQRPVNLPNGLKLSKLRAWLPDLDADLRALEAIDRRIMIELRLQYGPHARLADGD
jgi:hypothetical protein